MVDKNKILKLYNKYFDKNGEQIKSGDVTVADDGLVSVTDSVWLLKDTTQLPIGFDKIHGNFDAKNNSLESLENFPKWVESDLFLQDNQLTNLVGGPTHVGDDLNLFDNPLETLEGFPEFVGGTLYLNWNDTLPLLRTLVVQKNIMVYGKVQVAEILNRYRGQGRAGAFDCRRELRAAGFEKNARW